MLVKLWKTHRFGRRLPQRSLLAAPVLTGALTYSETQYKATGAIGSLTLNEVTNQTTGGNLGVLLEPQLVALGGNRMRFRGIESVDGAGYVQEWLVEIGLPQHQ